MRPRMILFVCTANQCRSPMAEHLLRRRLGPDAGWRTSSAGLLAFDGMPPTPEAVACLREVGLDLSSHRARRLDASLMAQADVVLTMTGAQAAELGRLFPRSRSRVFRLADLGTDPRPLDIEDPVGAGADVYRRTREDIDSLMPDVILFLHQRGPSSSAPPGVPGPGGPIPES